jgi:hypothetical protein
LSVTIYDRRDDCLRAARRTLKEAGRKDPLVGVHFSLEQSGEGWVWHEIDPATGNVADGELAAPEEGGFKSAGISLGDLAEEMSKPKETRDQKRLRKIREADERNAKALAAAAEKPKRQKPAEARSFSPKEPSKRAAMKVAAQRGEIPPAPDFSAETHKRWRPVLARVVELVEKRDVEGLMAVDIERKSSSRNAIANYRDLCITALEAQRVQNNGGPVHIEPQQPEASA